jgi:hypothetical protein
MHQFEIGDVHPEFHGRRAHEEVANVGPL